MVKLCSMSIDDDRQADDVVAPDVDHLGVELELARRQGERAATCRLGIGLLAAGRPGTGPRHARATCGGCPPSAWLRRGHGRVSDALRLQPDSDAVEFLQRVQGRTPAGAPWRGQVSTDGESDMNVQRYNETGVARECPSITEDGHRHAVQSRRVVAPLAHGRDRGRVEQRHRSQHAHVRHLTRRRDRRLQNHGAGDASLRCDGRVDRRDVMEFARRADVAAHAQ